MKEYMVIAAILAAVFVFMLLAAFDGIRRGDRWAREEFSVERAELERQMQCIEARAKEAIEELANSRTTVLRNFCKIMDYVRKIEAEVFVHDPARYPDYGLLHVDNGHLCGQTRGVEFKVHFGYEEIKFSYYQGEGRKTLELDLGQPLTVDHTEGIRDYFQQRKDWKVSRRA